MNDQPHNDGSHADRQSVQSAFELAFGGAPEPIYWLSREGRFTDANRAACDLLAVSKDELLTLRYSEIDIGCSDDEWKALWERLVSQNSETTQRTHRSRAGRIFSARLTPVPVQRDGDLQVCIFVNELSDAKERFAEFERLNRSLQAAERMAALGSWRLDHDAAQFAWSREVFRILGREPSAGAPTVAEMLDLLHPEDSQQFNAALQACRENGTSFELELRLKQGRAARYLRCRGEAVQHTKDAVRSVVGVIQDISDYKATERDLVDAKRRLQLAVDGGEIGLYVAEPRRRELSRDYRCQEMLGFAIGEPQLPWREWFDRMHPDDRPRVEEALRRIEWGGDDRFEAEYRMRHRSGHWIWVLDRARVYERDADGRVLRYAGSLVDATRRKEAEHKLEYLVDHDELTGLLNRRGVLQSIHQIHARCLRNHSPHCIAIADLDHFKHINDTYGHKAGDRVLRTVSDTLRSTLRRADWLGRWGGEEFVIILPETTEAQALVTLERLRKRVSAASIDVDGSNVQITMSAGIATCRSDKDEPDTMLARADVALYRAKSEGRDRVCYEGKDPQENQAVSVALLLQNAVRSDQVVPAYQPIVALRDRRIVGEETLARIIDPAGTTINAADFLDVADQLGLMHRIDETMLRATLTRATLEARPKIRRFVHISADVIQRPDILKDIAAISKDHSPGLGQLVLTLDEAELGERIDALPKVLAPLLSEGCSIALAGFGGRRTSLDLLARLPVEYLEICSDLVRRSVQTEQAQRVLEALIRSAKALAVTTIAKQVEDEDTAERLSAIGVDWASGYLFGAPNLSI
jgi:diguanylate cyclase (GGDEF)-like protein/PAS domain S-box-containing protein